MYYVREAMKNGFIWDNWKCPVNSRWMSQISLNLSFSGGGFTSLGKFSQIKHFYGFPIMQYIM